MHKSTLSAFVLISIGLLAGPSVAQDRLPVKSGSAPFGGTMQPADWVKPFVPSAPQPKLIEHGSRWPTLPVVAETAPLDTPPTPAPRQSSGANPLTLPVIQANRTVKFAGQFRSTVSEPATSQFGNTLFYTHNWDAAISTNGGLAWTRRDPRRLPTVDGGFCCDQYTIHVPTPGREMTLWLLQYGYGSATQKNVQRICVYRSEADLRRGAVWWWDFSPSLFGFSATHWLDFPHMAYGSNYAYATSNVFKRNSNGSNTYAGSVCYRMSLADLKTKTGSLPFTYLAKGASSWTWRLAQGIKGTAYWWELTNSANGRLYWWPETATTITSRSIAIASYAYATGAVSRDKSGRNFMGRADSRPLAGWVGKGVIGFAWMAGAKAGRPHPYTRFIRFSESTKNRINEIDVWNAAGCWAYPATGVNSRGDVGGVIAYGQSDRYPGTTCWIMDPTDPSPVQNALYFASGAGGPLDNSWGDYMTVVPHPKYPGSWIGTGMSLDSTNGYDSNQIPRFVWFGRAADLQVKPDLTPTSLTASTTSLQPLAFVQLYSNVLNDGPGASTSAAWIGWYLSDDAVIATNDRLLGTTAMQAQAAHTGRLYQRTVQVPGNATPGLCYLGVYADHTNQNAEEFESNNTRAMPVVCKAPLADLMVSALQVTPTTFKRAQSIAVQSIVRNSGSAASTACTSAYYVSLDSLITTTDLLLTTFSTPAIAPQSTAPLDSRSTLVPRTAPLGPCYVGAYADTLNSVVESSDTNNYRSQGVVCEEGLPDLQISKISADATATGGSAILVGVTTANPGVGPAPASVTGVLLSTSATISVSDELLGSFDIGPLGSGQTATRASRFTVPRCYAPSKGYIGAWADVTSVVTEQSEVNNTGVSTVVAIAPYSGNGRYLEWQGRLGTAGVSSYAAAEFKLADGPRSASMCIVAPQHAGDFHVLFWSASRTVALDPLSDFSFRFANTKVLKGFLGFMPASGRSYPSQNLPKLLGVPRIQIFTHSAWFDAGLTTFKGFGSNQAEAFVSS